MTEHKLQDTGSWWEGDYFEKFVLTNDVSILLQLFTTYFRPLLESNTQVWNPWLHQDIHSIEKVQRFFTRAVCRRAKLSYMDYGTRLRNLNLQSLEYRRVFFDLVMCYKIVFHLVDVDVSDFFVINSHVHFTRGNHFKLKSRSLPHHNFRLNFFQNVSYQFGTLCPTQWCLHPPSVHLKLI